MVAVDKYHSNSSSNVMKIKTRPYSSKTDRSTKSIRTIAT